MFWPVILLTAIGFAPAMVSDEAVPQGYPTEALCRARLEQMIDRVKRTPAIVPYLAGQDVTMASNCIRQKPKEFFRDTFGNDGDKYDPDGSAI